jgi:hypothetical protein
MCRLSVTLLCQMLLAGSACSAPASLVQQVADAPVDAGVLDAGATLPGAAADAAAHDASLADAELVGACLAGTYSGKSHCLVNFLRVVNAPNAGEIAIELVANPQGDPNVLVIAPGGLLRGKDIYGGTLSAQLSGELDCRSGTLTGTLVNGAYANGVASQPYSGEFSAVYRGDQQPPSLENGTMTMTSEQLPATTTCAWTLQRE